MALHLLRGDLFDAQVEAIVIPVNCVGESGSGITKEARRRYYSAFKEYRQACEDMRVRIGQVFIVPVQRDPYLRWIINFPTRYDLHESSQLEFIEEGIDSLATTLVLFEIRSVAIPALGCGSGHLSWSDIQPRLIDGLEHLDETQIFLYAPLCEVSDPA